MQRKYLNITDTCKFTTISRSVIYRLMKESDFPKSKKIKGVSKRVVWVVEEVERWMVNNLTKVSS